jgi:hypothetical protein
MPRRSAAFLAPPHVATTLFPAIFASYMDSNVRKEISP